MYSKAKIPFGTYAFGEHLEDLFSDIEKNRNSFLELTDTLTSPVNILSVSNSFEPSPFEVSRLLSQIDSGSNAFISAHFFGKQFLDTLGVNLDSLHKVFGLPMIGIMDQGDLAGYRFSLGDYLLTDTAHIKTTNSNFSPSGNYPIKNRDVFSHFKEIGSSNISVLATYHGEPVVLKVIHGKGELILSSIPHIFSNIYLVQGGNKEMIEYLLSYLPAEKLIWTEFYEVGRAVSQTPLRYIISQPALKNALYLFLISMLMFILFEIKRKQRAIPIVVAPSNESLQFVGTIGNLYYEKRQNLSIAQKRVQFFLDFLRTYFYLKTDKLDEEFVNVLSRKSGMPHDRIKRLADQIVFIKSNQNISDELLVSFSNTLDDFYKMNPKQ